MRNIIEIVSLVALVAVYFGIIIYLYLQKSAMILELSYSMSYPNF